MHYRKLHLGHFELLKQLVYDVYELHSDEEIVYSTAPNGIIGISVILEGKSYILDDRQWKPAPGIFVYGLVSKPDVIRLSRGFREIAIGFKPYFLQLLLKDSMSQVAGVPNADAFDFFGYDALKVLHNQLYESRSDLETLSAVELFLSRHINASKEDKRLMHAIGLVYEKRVRSVAELSEAINLSSTSLRQLFRDRVGQSPKEVIRILRLNEALRKRPGPEESMTDLCYSLGYFDQSHFIHDFKNTFGITPRSYFQNNELTFDFYNFGRWKGNIFVKNIDP